jgi:hypothetical protein
LSLANFYMPSSCPDMFTLTFNPTPTGAPAGPVQIGAADAITTAASAGTPTLTSFGTLIGGAAAPFAQWTYGLTDTTTSLSSTPAANLTVYTVETQSFSGVATGTAVGSGLTAHPPSIISSLNGVGSPCAACHLTGNAAWNATANGNGSAAANALADNSTTPATGLATGTCNTVAAADGNFSGVTKCIDTTTPTKSAVYQNACVVANHQGNTTMLTGPQCANLLQWIAEGANLN